jgi:hypothetical protein
VTLPTLTHAAPPAPPAQNVKNELVSEFIIELRFLIRQSRCQKDGPRESLKNAGGRAAPGAGRVRQLQPAPKEWMRRRRFRMSSFDLPD